MNLSAYGLSARFFIFLTVVITLIVGLVNYYGYRNTRDHLWTTFDSSAASKLESLSRISGHYMETYELELLGKLQQQINAEDDVVYLLIKDDDGELLFGKPEPGFTHHKIYTSVITLGPDLGGELVLALSTEAIRRELVSARFSSLLMFLFTTLILSGAIYSFFRTEVIGEVERARQEEDLLREQHNFMRAVTDHSEGLLVVMDLSGTIIHLNQRCAYLLGVSMEEAVGAKLTRYCEMQSGEADLSAILRTLSALPSGDAVDQNVPMACLSECRNLRDESRYVEWHFNLLSGSQGNPRYLIGSGVDITARRQHEQHLLLAQQVIENASEAIIVTDAQGFIEMVNPSFYRISGYSSEEAIGRNPRFMQSGQHDEDFYAKMWSSIKEHGTWHGEIWNKRKNGEVFPEAITVTALKDATGEVSKYVAIFTDITDQKLSEQYLSHLAHHDLLTTLPNRVLFIDLLDKELCRTKRYQEGFGLLYLDLDRFKPVNDKYGHEAGDEVLKVTALRMKSCVRESDTVARLGGDEFAILLPNLNDEKALAVVAEKILISCSDAILWQGDSLNIGVSIGGIIDVHGDREGEEMLRQVDELMYHSKQRGRNTYTIDSTQ